VISSAYGRRMKAVRFSQSGLRLTVIMRQHVVHGVDAPKIVGVHRVLASGPGRRFLADVILHEGAQRGPIGPLPASGARTQFDFGAVFRMADCKIAEWWITWDNMTILRQLGHMPV